MNNRTPGPWRHIADKDARGNPCWVIDTPTVGYLATLTYSSTEQRDAQEADAQAIAAVPELIDALRGLVELLPVNDGSRRDMEDCAALCAAARKLLARIDA